ncbi:hypothetical protein RND81_06G041900 [Saponaria officinalis]|uniref:BED-type domain-containing protein n=1 Tax=Saponaria officinalis TaxID=3572 RepID=A0AAW1K9J3_SAPOF
MTREVSPGGDVRAICVYCKKVFNANSGNGTSHLNRHMKKCALRFNHDIKKFCIGGTPSNAGMPSMSLKNPSANLDEVRRAICVYVVAGSHPFLTCEEPGFRFMMSVTCPQFKNVNRHTLKRDAIKYYNEERRVVEEELKNAPGRICFTTDNWRSDHTHDEYMCITAHWVDSNWNLQKRIIKFGDLTPLFDGISLADEITLCLGKWKIADKVLSFTVDNASYNDSMINSLKTHFMRKNLLVYDGDFFHIRYSAHIINLVVQAGLLLIDDVVVKIRSVVKHLRHSIPKRKKFYEIAQSAYSLNVNKRLRGDTCIRWNSTYLMLDRYIYFRDVVDNIVSRDRDIKVYHLSYEEWEKVIELHEFLKVFYDVTNSFSASKTSTANIYFLGVWKIHKKLVDVYNNRHSFLSDMVNKMHEKFNKYWSDYSVVLSCAAVLDPRFKLERVEYFYEKLFGEVYAKETIESIKKTLYELYDEYKSAIGASYSINNNSEADHVDVVDEETEDDGDYAAFLSKKRKTNYEKSELRLYFEEKNVNVKDDLDVLLYWKNQSHRFPCLSCLARDILTIPVSTVPSESAFSMGKKLINPWRSSLSLKTIEALACHQDWLRARGFSCGRSSFFDYEEEVDEEENEEEDDNENHNTMT